MAAYDVMPWQSPHGGTVRVQHFRLNANESFRIGEPVSVNADGELTEAGDDPVDADIIGIAAANGDNTITSDAPSSTHIATAKIYPTTAADGFPNTGDLIPVWMIDPTTYWITSRFSNGGGDGTTATPALANIGDEAGLTLAAAGDLNGNWAVDTGAANNICRIIDVLDSNKTSVQVSGGTGVFVVFAIVAHQLATLGTADAPVA